MMKLLSVLCHCNLILALSFTVFAVLDHFNPLMNFVENSVTTPLLLVFCALSASISFVLAVQVHYYKR